MPTEYRIETIRLLDLMKENTEYASKIGIHEASHYDNTQVKTCNQICELKRSE